MIKVSVFEIYVDQKPNEDENSDANILIFPGGRE